jgi:hypothetical protein
MLHPSGGPPIVHVYDIAIADLVEAAEAARKASGSDAGTIVETIGQLASTTDLRTGGMRLR